MSEWPTLQYVRGWRLWLLRWQVRRACRAAFAKNRERVARAARYGLVVPNVVVKEWVDAAVAAHAVCRVVGTHMT